VKSSAQHRWEPLFNRVRCKQQLHRTSTRQHGKAPHVESFAHSSILNGRFMRPFDVVQLLLGEEWIRLAQVRAFKSNFTDAGHPNGGMAHHHMVSEILKK
jgi:hypothetical protein